MKIQSWILKVSVVGMMAAAMASGCSSSPHKTDQSPIAKEASENETHPSGSLSEANHLDKALTSSMAARNGASDYGEIYFRKGSSHLDRSQRKQLVTLVTKSLHDGRISELKVVSFADRPYPLEGEPPLSATDQKLADKRNNQIKAFIHQKFPDISVTVYNMAKRPNELQNVLETSAAKTKDSYEQAGVAAMGQTGFEKEGLRSRALIFAIFRSK